MSGSINLTANSLPYLVSGSITLLAGFVWILGKLYSSTQVQKFDKGETLIWGGVSFLALVLIPSFFATLFYLYSIGPLRLDVGAGLVIFLFVLSQMYGLKSYEFAAYPLYGRRIDIGRLSDWINKINPLAYLKTSLLIPYLALGNYLIIHYMISESVAFTQTPGLSLGINVYVLVTGYLLSLLFSVANLGYRERTEMWVRINPDGDDERWKGILTNWRNSLYLVRPQENDTVISNDEVEEVEIIERLDS